MCAAMELDSSGWYELQVHFHLSVHLHLMVVEGYGCEQSRGVDAKTKKHAQNAVGLSVPCCTPQNKHIYKYITSIDRLLSITGLAEKNEVGCH